MNASLMRAACALLLGIASATPALAHGYAGARFFPATIGIEDPAAADELALPTYTHRDGESEYSAEYTKRITSRLAFSIEGAWLYARENGETIEGLQNIETGLKWQFFTSAEHEEMLSAGLGVEWGGSGDADAGAEDNTVIAPALFFGKGFGDLAGAGAWRALAVTGQIGAEIPVDGHDEDGEPLPRAIVGGVSLQYSLPYLNAQVRAHDWSEWIDRLTPLVEFTFENPIHNGGDEGATGAVRPGLLWTGRHMQLGAEAIIPINDASGEDVGLALQAHFFLDDLAPHTLGRPIFGAGRP